MSTNGIEFVIGGKDQAKPAMAAVEQSLKRMEQSTDRVSESTSRLTKLTIGIAGAYAAFRGAMASLSAVMGGMDDFDAAQESIRSLNQAMDLNGGTTDALRQRYADLSDSIEAATNVAAEDVQGLMKQAAVMGVSNDKLGDMATAAIGLSEALGVSLDTGLEKVRLATEGNFKAFEKLLPAIKQMQTDEEKLAAVMELSHRGLALKAEASKSAAGESERMHHRIGNLMETIGAMLSPVRELAYKGIALLADALSGVLAPAVESTAQWFREWEPVIMQAMQTAVNAVVKAVTFIEVALTHLPEIWELAVAQAELYMIQITEAVSHALTEVIPAYVMWFGDNFINLMRDAVSLAYTVVSNHVTKLVDTFKALWEFIATKGSSDVLGKLGEISGRSYLDGFTSSLTELPTIAARQITSRERELSGTIAKIGDKLGEEFSEKLSQRMVAFGDDALSLDYDLDLSIKQKAEDAVSAAAKNSVPSATAGGLSFSPTTQATEGRLLTRGPGVSVAMALNNMDRTMKAIASGINIMQGVTQQQLGQQQQINNNTKNKTQLVPTP